jgi:hypothetical protein
MVNTAATSLLENGIPLQIVYGLMMIRYRNAPEMIPTHCPHSGSSSLLLPAGRLPFRVVKVLRTKNATVASASLALWGKKNAKVIILRAFQVSG